MIDNDNDIDDNDVSDKIRYAESSIERVVGLPSLQNR